MTAPSEVIWGLVDAALLADDYKRRWPALSALRCAPDIEWRIVDYLRRSDLSEATKLDIIDHLHDAQPDKGIQLHFALAHAENKNIEERYRYRLRVVAASLGDETTMHALVSEFDTLPVDVISSTLMLFGHHRSRQLGTIAVDKIRARGLESVKVVTISHGLLIGATYIAKMLSFRSATLHPGPPHPAYDLFVALIDEWRLHRQQHWSYRSD